MSAYTLSGRMPRYSKHSLTMTGVCIHKQSRYLKFSKSSKAARSLARFSSDSRIRSKRLGLTSMQERAEALGGRLDFISAPGSGTTVRLELAA